MKKSRKLSIKKDIKKLKPFIKMDQKIIKFDDTEIEEQEFQQYKSFFSINDLDINKIVVSNKFPFGKQDFKHFVGQKDSKKLDLYAYSVLK